jgi:hypothetical protein
MLGAKRSWASGGVSKLFAEDSAAGGRSRGRGHSLDTTEQQTRARGLDLEDGVFHGEAFLHRR